MSETVFDIGLIVRQAIDRTITAGGEIGAISIGVNIDRQWREQMFSSIHPSGALPERITTFMGIPVIVSPLCRRNELHIITPELYERLKQRMDGDGQ